MTAFSLDDGFVRNLTVPMGSLTVSMIAFPYS